MITAWRIIKTRHARSSFDGEGARLHGGRWNSVGTPVAYASQSVSLATLEILAGLQNTAILSAYSLVSIQFEPKLVKRMSVENLPANWRRHPPPPELLAIGDRWANAGRSVILQVPSAIVPSEANYLINPLHRDFSSLIISEPKPFTPDPRLL